MLQHRWLLNTCIILALSLSLVACSSGAAPVQNHLQSRPTATPIPANTVLYQANWSHDFARWHASSGWKLVNGQPQTDLSETTTMTAPYIPAVDNYAVEFRLQVISVPHDGGYYMLWVDKTATRDGYHADILNLLTPGSHVFAIHPLSEVLLDPEDSMGPLYPQVFDYEPGTQWHTYRVEVRGARVDFFINQVRVSRAISQKTKTLSTGPIRLETGKAVLRVDDFRVMTL